MGQLISVRPILCNNKFAKIVIDIKTMTFNVVDLNTNEVLCEGVAGSIPSLKNAAKQAAKNIGANFSDEVRNNGSIRKFVIDES